MTISSPSWLHLQCWSKETQLELGIFCGPPEAGVGNREVSTGFYHVQFIVCNPLDYGSHGAGQLWSMGHRYNICSKYK